MRFWARVPAPLIGRWAALWCGALCSAAWAATAEPDTPGTPATELVAVAGAGAYELAAHHGLVPVAAAASERAPDGPARADRAADAGPGRAERLVDTTEGLELTAVRALVDIRGGTDPSLAPDEDGEPMPFVLTLPEPDLLPPPFLQADPDTVSAPAFGMLVPPESGPAAPGSEAGAAGEAAGSSNLWDRLRAGFRLAAVDTPLVRQHVRAFASAPDDLARIVERSRRYLYFILGEVEKRGMPAEIALLPMVESAFDPRAFSRSQASGMWQFLPATGTRYGLRQNWWYDGRRDVLTSTYSALAYLAKLHGRFGSWELALAAYNCGENRVARAIDQNASQGLRTDYWALSLPVETLNYVPKLLALRALVREPDRHGVWLAPIANRPYFTPIKTTRNLDLKQAASFAGITEDEFLALNPAYNRPMIGGTGQRTILVPAQSADLFSARLKDASATLVSWRMHLLKRGEVLDSVADHFGWSGAELKRVNGIDASRTLAGGGVILVPARDAGGAEPRFDASLRPESEVPEPPRTLFHRVAPGESLGSIAAMYRTTAQMIRTANRLGPRSRIIAGQRLIVPVQAAAAPPTVAAAARATPPARARARLYTVRRGDTLFGIARKLGVAVADLQRCNRMTGHTRLAPGAVLTLPESATD
jgi:membrane-bound lytic murein transglycosylase D